ncbi:hypothetical protein SAMN04489712_14111 [Thermomonospora echinospora]|uniref:DUF6884 domain-containing protein n=1 Tax=Thermomonospora echinospora TaxID=1992 RepID=A0A1H6E812_9ACTN|nr:DUF6884 domain-containing protein [Thermomonospora echinospora]SEG93860.1 hypothetical protein SAMN04489712_14111 [Thermomonospora echinospora]
MNPSSERSALPLVITGCSRRKRNTQVPLPALDLYEGGCIPELRRRLGHIPAFRARLRILSAEHGLIGADEPLLPYDRKLTPSRAAELRPLVTEHLRREFAATGTPPAVLLAAGPDYQSLVVGLLGSIDGLRLQTVDDTRHWAAISSVLDGWGWP